MNLNRSEKTEELAPSPTPIPDTSFRVLVTGATGYVGGRLVPSLLEAGYSVRCIVRAPDKLRDRAWFAHPGLEVVQGDLSDIAELQMQLRGCDAAYYLIHSMVAAGPDYAERDHEMARRFAAAFEQ